MSPPLQLTCLYVVLIFAQSLPNFSFEFQFLVLLLILLLLLLVYIFVIPALISVVLPFAIGSINFFYAEQVSYLQVFSSWMHFCAVRIFAESILRYGLPPSFLVYTLLFSFLVFQSSICFLTEHGLLKGFQACVIAPSVKSEKKVRSILEGLCGNANRQVHKTLCIFYGIE